MYNGVISLWVEGEPVWVLDMFCLHSYIIKSEVWSRFQYQKLCSCDGRKDVGECKGRQTSSDQI